MERTTRLQQNSFSYLLILQTLNICVSLDVNFNESLTNDIVNFEQLGPDKLALKSISKLISVPKQVVYYLMAMDTSPKEKTLVWEYLSSFSNEYLQHMFSYP